MLHLTFLPLECLMGLTTILLPRQQLSSRQGDVEVSLQPAVSLSLPQEIESLSTYSELARAVEEQHLWIARNGPCNLSISLATLGKPLMTSERQLAEEWIMEYDVRHPEDLDLSWYNLPRITRFGTAWAFNW